MYLFLMWVREIYKSDYIMAEYFHLLVIYKIKVQNRWIYELQHRVSLSLKIHRRSHFLKQKIVTKCHGFSPVCKRAVSHAWSSSLQWLKREHRAKQKKFMWLPPSWSRAPHSAVQKAPAYHQMSPSTAEVDQVKFQHQRV